MFGRAWSQLYTLLQTVLEKQRESAGVCVCVCVCSSHLEVLYSRGLLCSVTEDWALAIVPTTVLQDVIKGLKVWSKTTQTYITHKTMYAQSAVRKY